MINIQFVKEIPSESMTYVVPVYDHDHILPAILSEMMEHKPHIKVVDVLDKEANGYRRYIGVRLGKQEESKRKDREEAGAELYKKVSEGIESEILIDFRHLTIQGHDLLMGIMLSSWRFDAYRTRIKAEEKSYLHTIFVLCTKPKELELLFKRQRAIAEGVFYARSLTSEPPNILYPAAYAEKLQELRNLGIQVEILDEEKLRAIGMTALLSAGKGSYNPPHVIILTWNGTPSATNPIAFIGKGVCFDSGGLCLKPAAQQHDMKWDKAGAGVVAGLFKALALSEASVYTIGILGLVENMPDGSAMKPGDVITTMSGQTVEIVNTDAEGRLVLADCLWYAQARFSPKALIDLGTLTVETFASLGTAYAGLYSNDFRISQQLKNAGDATGDLLWELPMGPYFAKQIESSVADMKNVGVDFYGENGAAAEFIKRFISTVPWAHIDIAGVSWTHEEISFTPKEVTGFGVRLLEEWIQEYLIKQ